MPSRGYIKNTPLREREGERGREGGKGGREGGRGGRGGNEGRDRRESRRRKWKTDHKHKSESLQYGNPTSYVLSIMY